MNLNDDAIYYGLEASKEYMGVSQYKDFIKCEAYALAKLNGEIESDIDSQALLVGNYLHSYFESKEAHGAFKVANKEALYSKRKPFGLLKAFEVAETMIATLEAEPLFNYLWQGEREVVVTGELFGAKWKGKIDLLNVEKGYFVDLKTTADMNKRFYSSHYGSYVSFVENYGYVLQITVYEKLLEMKYGKEFIGYIYAISKQDIPQVAAIEIENHKKEFELNQLEANLVRVLAVKTGLEEPTACGKCDYCKSKQKLSGFVTTDQLIG